MLNEVQALNKQWYVKRTINEIKLNFSFNRNKLKLYLQRFGEKCGVWKVRGVENVECGKFGVWKIRGVENEKITNVFLR